MPLEKNTNIRVAVEVPKFQRISIYWKQLLQEKFKQEKYRMTKHCIKISDNLEITGPKL